MSIQRRISITRSCIRWIIAGRASPGSLRRYSGSERNYRIMLDNEENPYTTSPGTVYRWGRSRCLGGRTLHWARATDRMADYEFKAASLDGYGMNWEVTYADMKPYYDRVESFIGVSARHGGLGAVSRWGIPSAHAAELRGSDFHRGLQEPGLALHAPPAGAIDASAQQPPAVPLLRELREWLRCGAMFNTVAVTLPPALKTGNLEVRTDSVVARIRMNNENRAQGVTYIERYTKKSIDVDAKYVILAASTLENTRLMLLSAKGGLANSSGTLGQYMMDQVGGGGVSRISADSEGRSEPSGRWQSRRHHHPDSPELR